MRFVIFFSYMCVCSALSSLAEIVPNSLFQDHCVLQREMKVPVWGAANPGERIVVRFRGDNEVTTCDREGHWSVKIESGDAGGPFVLEILGETDVVRVRDVLVGEVWIASGQSNMDRPLRPVDGQKPIINGMAEAAKADYPKIRHFYVPQSVANSKQENLDGSWTVCSPETVNHFSAIGYFFSRDLLHALDVPVGIIRSSWGGTPVQSWASEQVFEKYPEYDDRENRAVHLGKEKQNDASVLFNGMIAPLAPFGIKGVIWYQGESNAYDPVAYRSLFPAMIEDWRREWEMGNFPFLYVQIAPFEGMPPEIREAQLLTLDSVENTAMIVTIDVGDATDIHPANKEPVGERLALAARALGNGEDVIYSGPHCKSVSYGKSRVVVSFDWAQPGLVSGDGLPLRGFEIAGEDGVYFPARAEIEDDEILLFCSDVETPVAVRYAWADVADGNLFNKAGLPASPFRTDFK